MHTFDDDIVEHGKVLEEGRMKIDVWDRQTSFSEVPLLIFLPNEVR